MDPFASHPRALSQSLRIQPSSSKKRVVSYHGPIATLQSQWDEHLQVAKAAATNGKDVVWKNGGNFQTYLLVRIHEDCIIPPSGVEAVLQWNNHQGGVDRRDPTQDPDTTTNSTTSTNHHKKGLGFLASGLKKAQGAIERSMTTMAIRADGGKNRDWVCMSLYCRECNEAQTNTAEICLSRTEWVQLPSSDAWQGMSFHIPLSVPDLEFLKEMDTGGGGPCLTIRISIRSGAALLNIVKREYPIGECTIHYSNLLSMMNEYDERMQDRTYYYYSNTRHLPLTKGMLAETSNHPPPAIQLTALQRIKFAPLCHLGWSLTHPISTAPNPYNNRWLNMFHLPLDQAYVFPIRHHHQLLHAHRFTCPHPSSTDTPLLLVANETAVESTLTLPIATAVSRLMAESAKQSAQIASIAAKRAFQREYLKSYAIPAEDPMKANAIADAAIKDGCADVEIGVVALMLENGAVGPPVSGMMTFQRCDSIFEETLVNGFSLPLMDKSAAGEAVWNAPKTEAFVKRFCPRIYTGSYEQDGGDALLPGVVGTSPHGYVGSVRLTVAASLGSSTADAVFGVTGGVTLIEGVVPLEPYLNPTTQRPEKVPVLVPAIDANNGNVVGKFLFLLRVKTIPNRGRLVETPYDATNGLISMIGLNTLTEDMGISYEFDNCPVSSTNTTVRARQVATMGAFLTSTYLKNHAEQRAKDASILIDRFEKYYSSLSSAVTPDVTTEDESSIPLFKQRTPKPFRPSNSRQDPLLAGIGFNVHVQAMTLHLLQDGQEGIPAGINTSVTHGAPADHARGFRSFGNDDNESITELARGGLRRLESARLEYAREVDDNITGLINAVGEYFNMRSHITTARQQAGVKTSRHVPTNIQGCNYYRNRVVESMQKLHSLTWEISVRRVNCFSQALGIAVTSYMTSLSEGGQAWRFANIWAQHGYLVTFEGLLSAVGKELGMIEDASTAIEMLRMVTVVLIPAENEAGSDNTKIPVVHSPFLRSVHLQKQMQNRSMTNTEFKLEIAIEPSYFHKQVPPPLQGTPIRFVPVLFQMGVDIRQWGANAGRNVTTQIKDRTKSAGGVDECCTDIEIHSGPVCGLIDDGDDDDENGMADTEILTTLNLEGFLKLNVYAHTINPTSTTPPSISSMNLEQMQALPAHHFLTVLNDTIKSSYGKMEHGVLDHAATVCQRLGGGSTVFCKSGKDRTAMQVTFKQAQFLQRFVEKKDTAAPVEDVCLSSDEVFANSTLMRIHGTRVPICEKNAGESKYAFNPLQAKFMPDALKPPPIALAGFLKKPET